MKGNTIVKKSEAHFNSDILTVKEVAAYLQIHWMTAYRWANRGELPGAFKLGGRWRFKKAVVDRYFEES